MASNNFTILPFSTVSQGPRILFLSTTEDFATITEPGFLNTAGTAGVTFQPNDFLFVQYNEGENSGLFNITVNDGIYTMSVYNPNSNSFTFQRVQFVAKGGSDLNAGTSIGSPKLTVQAAINALAPNLTDPSLVNILDDGTYNENIVLPLNINIYGPNATIGSTTGDTLTVQDSGQSTFAVVNVSNLGSDAGLAINLLGPSSILFANASIIQGNIYSEGSLILKDGLALVGATVTIAANSNFSPDFINCIGCTFNFDPTSTVVGNLGQITPGSLNNAIYGKTSFIDDLIYQTTPNTVTAGLTVDIADSNTRIVYNNVSNDSFVLPQTSDVAIPLGTNIEFTQLGLGAIEFVAGAGVTIVSQLGSTVTSNGSGSTSKAWKYTDTVWIISGDIASVGP